MLACEGMGRTCAAVLRTIVFHLAGCFDLVGSRQHSVFHFCSKVESYGQPCTYACMCTCIQYSYCVYIIRIICT